MARLVEKAERLRRELEGAARASGGIGTGRGSEESGNGVAEMLQKMRRDLAQGGRFEWRRQNL